MARMRRIAQATAVAVCVGMLATAAVAQNSGNTAPVAAFSASLAQGSGATVRFDASASADPDGKIVAYQWVFGDGSTGSGAVKDHTYEHADRYTVTLLVIDDAGGTGMVSQPVDIENLQPRSSRSPTPVKAPVATSFVEEGNRVGQRAPAFSLPGTDGPSVQLSDYAGQVVILEFWTSSCPACQASMAELEALRIRYEAQGLVVILISIEQTATGAVNFLEGMGYGGFVSAIDIYWPTRPTRSAYGVGHVPHAFLIDRQGVIRYSGAPGQLTAATAEAWI
jgi:thiol-disulfide isomerase/thioredoxin